MGFFRRFGVAAITAVVLAGSMFYSSPSQAAEKIDAYEKVDASAKLASSDFTCSNSNVSMKYYDRGNGVMIKGTKEDLTAAKYEFKDSFDFGSKSPDYMVFDGLAQKKKDISLEFYLDDSDKPFAIVKMNKQSRDKVWTKSQNLCVNFKDANVTGVHKVSFKVVTDEKKDLSLLFRYMLFIKSDIPTVDFNIDESQGSISAMNGDSEHQTECYGKMTLDIPNGYKSEYTDKELKTQTYALDYLRGRGNSTWMADKKPYKIKLDKKADLLGMGSNKHWVLLANYYDITMLRNKITYWLGAQLGMEFTPKCEFVNVVMNGQYLGSYYLCQQVRVGDSRVDIDDLEATEESKNATDEPTITGGYLLSMFPYSEAASGQVIKTKKDQVFLIESPEFDEYYNDAQFKYISNYVQKTEDAIYGKGFKDENGVSYKDYMDVDAAVDYYWVQEFSMNGDAFGSGSTYLYKKRNGKLFWGPLWDFDYVAWGATEYTGNNVEGYTCNTSTWFEGLMKDPEFCKKVIERWPAIKKKLLEAAEDGGQIDKYSEKQYQSQKANYEILKKYSDNYADGFWDEDGVSEIVNDVTYDNEEKRLKNWIKERVDWIDNNLDQIKTEYYTLKFKVGNKDYASIQCSSKGGVDLPVDPSKKGYVFKGWFAKVKAGKETYEVQITADSMLTGDMTAYAKWEKATSANKLSKITFQSKEYYMSQEDSLYLNVYTMPFDYTISNLKWTSSDEKIAKVDEYGNVSAGAKKGDVVITAQTKDGKKAKCTVHVISWREVEDVQGFEISKDNMTLTQGQYSQIDAKVIPKKACYGNNFVFTSTNTDIVDVNDGGFIHANNPGTAYVFVYHNYTGTIKTCKITVKLNHKKNNVFSWKTVDYKITATGKKAAVKITGIEDLSKKDITIGSTITVSGKKYSITAIDINSFKNCPNLKSVTIKNKNISKKAVNNLKKKYKKIKFIVK